MTPTPDRPPVLPGAEPFSADGGPAGALVLHGFTGTPQSMRGLAQAFAAAGFAVELPLLPGHGTTVDDMANYGWADWAATADAAYERLAARCPAGVVVAGLSMGGALTAWMAARHPDVKGIVCINAAVKPAPAEMRDLVATTLAGGTAFFPGPGNDVADPAEKELAYEQMALAAAKSFFEGQEELDAVLPDIRCPVLIITSRQDHVVEPANSDYLAERVSGPVERVWLERSYHVATLDYDKGEIESRSVEFARKVTAG